MNIPGIHKEDLHVVFNGFRHLLKVFTGEGIQVGECEARGETTAAPGKLKFFGHFGKCPPGIYQLGLSEKENSRKYGFRHIPIIDVNGLWKKYIPPRAGIWLHGGGPWKTWRLLLQGWTITLGCLRLQNQDMEHLAILTDVCIGSGHTVYLEVIW